MASNNICKEEIEGSTMAVSPHLTAADTDGPQAAPFIRQQSSPLFWASILLELPGRGCSPTLKPQATRIPHY